jgi:amino acid adenylation domain-containing protein
MNTNIQDIYPLSPMQQGMLFHTLYAPETEVYIEQLCCKLIGDLNIEAFKNAWQQVVQRHDVLRSAFVWEGLDEPLQVVHKQVEVPFTILDWQNKSDDEKKKALDLFLKNERKEGLDLTSTPLMRNALMKLSENEHYFIWSHHHLLFDGWGLPIILQEIFQHYDAYVQGESLQLQPVRPFRSYIAWLQAQDMDKAEEFWRKKLSGFTAPTPFVVDSKVTKKGLAYVKHRVALPEELSEKLNSFVPDNQITLNTVIQGAWALLLNQYSGEDDIVFGSSVSGRPAYLPGVESMVGLFINTLPIRVSIDYSKTYSNWLKELQMQNVELRQYEYTPLVNIQGWSDVPRSLPLFQSLLVFENYPVGETLSESKSTLQITDVRSFERTNYPITLVASPGKKLMIEIAYEPEKFDSQVIRRMLKHIEIILDTITSNPDKNLSTLNLISDEEKTLTLKEWNGKATPYPENSTILDLFEKQVLENPEAIAVDYEDRTLTYKALNEQANQLSHVLQKKGVKPETIVGISLDRSIETVVSAIAVLKAGGAYVPIDPEYPEERIDYMIEDSGIQLLVTQKELSNIFKKYDLQLIVINADNLKLENENKENPQSGVLPHNLAYIIYTSGSTGRPKGVLLQHQGAVNFFINTNKFFLSEKGKSVLQLASFSFDAATAEIFIALLSGATVQMVKKETLLSTHDMVKFLNEKKVTTATIPPSLLTLLPEDEINSFETIVSVGDACTWDLASRWNKKCRFINGYGPTECTVGAIMGLIKEGEYLSVTLPIGAPIDNAKIYLLNQYLHPVPIGVPGEIYIGGPGVARGYHKRPALTAEKFIPDPFSEIEGARLYKTGDLARFLPDGNIEFIGRTDFQVKIRGFRIELGEIEAEIIAQDNVKDVVVLARGEAASEKSVAAYMVAQNGKEIDIQKLRTTLKGQLPEYMVPAAFVVMEAFPLTPNGKVNRKALPEHDKVGLISDDYVPPRTPEEEILAGIWAHILNLEKVGINSSFFDLGGHSLMATQVISRIRDAFEVDIPLRSLFETSTIAELAQQIDKIRKGEAGIAAPPLEKISRDEAPPLSFAQQRLWFLDQLEPGSASYNIPSAVRLSGKLNTAALEKSINEIIKRHESLRTTFASEDGKPVQVISDPTEFKIQIIDLTNLPETERDHETMGLLEEEAHSPFNLAEGPLFHAGLLKLADEEHIIAFNMHHIISDGWSVGVLINEVTALYIAFSKDLPSPLPDLPIQYADFAHWQRKWLDGEVLEKQINYWKKQLAGSPPLLELPTDHPRPAVQTFNGSTETIRLSKELSGALLELSRKEGVTPFMTLLAAFQTLLHRYSGQDEILVGSPIANRTHSKMENLIGFFVNTLVMKADFSDNPSFSDLLRQVRETALGAYAHQDMPFEKLVEEIQPQRDLSHSPLFQVAFALQNAPTREVMKLPDLTLCAVSSESGVAKFDLTLTMIETSEDIVGSLEYNTDLFEKATILRMINHFTALLEGIAAEPETEIADLPMLSEDERQKLLVDWNQYEAEFPDDKCVHQWFESYVEEQPQAPALAYKLSGNE